MTGGSEEARVDNPERERLVRLKRELEKERGELVGALRRAASEVGRGGRDSAKAWVGRRADRWHDEVAGHRRTIRARIDTVLEDIQREIDSMPEKVTPAEATSMHRNQRMY
jgi:hypothetical protein